MTHPTTTERAERLNASGLSLTTCWCGIIHSVPKALLDTVIAQGPNGTIYCPLGHSGCWPAGKTEEQLANEKAERLQRRLTAEQDTSARLQANLTAAKGQLTKARNRAAKGVCPHPSCKRSFVNVARHVATCHPELAALPKGPVSEADSGPQT